MNIKTTMSQPAANTSANRKSEHMLTIGAVWAALSLAALVWSLWGMTLVRGGGADAAAHNAGALWPFWIASASCWVGLTMLWLALRRRPAQHWRTSVAAMVVGVGIAARLTVLLTHEPALSDDVYRYVFDGRNLAHGLNPYLHAPADRSAALAGGAAENWRGEREILPALAYPEVATPYLPLSQYVFAALGAACEWGGWTSPIASARVFRSGFTLIEIGMMLVICLALRRRGLSPWWLALYAWHPLAIDGFAASGHQDVIGIALMVAALAVLPSPFGRGAGGEGSDGLSDRAVTGSRSPSPRPSPRGRGSMIVGMAALLALGMMVKPIAALAGLMALRRRPWRMWLLCASIAAIVCAALALPVRWHPGRPEFAAWKATADWMAEKAAHFAGVYEPVLCTVRYALPDGPQREPGFNLQQEWLARKICMGALAVAMLVLWWRNRDAWCATAAAMLLLVLCSTTCHPWYLLWALALFPISRGGWTLWVYSLTISLGYVVFISGKGHALGVEWTVQPWALALAYIPLLITLAIDFRSLLHFTRTTEES